MKLINKDLLAPCGLYCGVCRVHIAYRDNDTPLKVQILPDFREWGAKSIGDIACEGCLSEGVVFPFCQTCAIKDCVAEKEISGCRDCNEFPCEIIEKWPSPGGRKVMLRAIPAWRALGTGAWVEREEKRYQCPQCGTPLYRGASTCRNCECPVQLDFDGNEGV